MRSRAKVMVGCLLGTAAMGVSACGSSNDGGSSTSTPAAASGTTAAPATGTASGTVDVYSSLPLQGASKDQTGALRDGIKLALKEAGGKAGGVTVNYTSLDDSTAQAGTWDPQQVGANARKAVQDKKSVAYIGEFNSGASALSIPVLNAAGLMQVSPANTAVGLTKKETGSSPGEPEKYYPTGKRTYARIVPRDKYQAADLITQMKADGCKALAMANDKEVYGQGLATLLVDQAKTLGLKLTTNDGIQKDAANFRAFASKIKGQGADCFVFAGVTANGAIQIMKDVHAALPTAKLYGGDGICESGFTNPKKKGIPADVGKLFECTVGTLDLTKYPGGQKFLASFKAEYNDSAPDPYAIYGYEAMSLVLDAIKRAGSAGTTREGVVKAIFATKNRDSVLGTYSIDADGDTSSTDYGLYKVGPDGNPKYSATIKAQS